MTGFKINTSILMGDGTYKNIQDIQVGDIVKSYNTKTNKSSNQEVINIVNNICLEVKEFTFSNGTAITGCENTLFLKQNNKFGTVIVGDSVKLVDGTYATVTNINTSDSQTLYEIDIKKTDTFIINNIIVHNTDIPVFTAPFVKLVNINQGGDFGLVVANPNSYECNIKILFTDLDGHSSDFVDLYQIAPNMSLMILSNELSRRCGLDDDCMMYISQIVNAGSTCSLDIGLEYNDNITTVTGLCSSNVVNITQDAEFNICEPDFSDRETIITVDAYDYTLNEFNDDDLPVMLVSSGGGTSFPIAVGAHCTINVTHDDIVDLHAGDASCADAIGNALTNDPWSAEFTHAIATLNSSGAYNYSYSRNVTVDDNYEEGIARPAFISATWNGSDEQSFCITLSNPNPDTFTLFSSNDNLGTIAHNSTKAITYSSLVSSGHTQLANDIAQAINDCRDSVAVFKLGAAGDYSRNLEVLYEWFTTVSSYTVTFRTGTGDMGTWSVSSIPNVSPGTSISLSGNTVTVGSNSSTFTPNAGYDTYIYWSPDGTTISDDTSVYVITTRKTYSITFTAPTNGYGSWGSSSKTAQYGDKITRSGNTVTCYKWDSLTEQRWSNTLTAQAADNTYTYGVTASGDSINSVTGNASFGGTSSRSLKNYTITWKYLSAYPDTWTTATETYHYNDTPSRTNPSTVTNSSSTERKIFSSWDSLAAVTANRTITATYTTQYYITVNANTGSSATNNGSNWYNSGTSNTTTWTVSNSAQYTFSSTRTTSQTTSTGSGAWTANSSKTISAPTVYTRQYTITWRKRTSFTSSTMTSITSQNYDYNATPSRSDHNTFTNSANNERLVGTGWNSLAKVTASRNIDETYTTQYYITVNANTGSTVTGNPSGWYDSGATRTSLWTISSDNAAQYTFNGTDKTVSQTTATSSWTADQSKGIAAPTVYTREYGIILATDGNGYWESAKSGEEVTHLILPYGTSLSTSIASSMGSLMAGAEYTFIPNTGKTVSSITSSVGSFPHSLTSDETITGSTGTASYTITWKYHDTYSTWTTTTQSYNYGATPSRTLPSTVTSGNTRLVATGWDSLATVTASRTITAVYKTQYNVTFSNSYATAYNAAKSATMSNTWYDANTQYYWKAGANYSYGGSSTADYSSVQTITSGGTKTLNPGYVNCTISGTNCTWSPTSGIKAVDTTITWTASAGYNFSGSSTTTQNVALGTTSYPKTASRTQAVVTTAPTYTSVTYNGSSQYLCNAGTATNGTMYYLATVNSSLVPTTSTSGWSTTRPTATAPGTVYWIWYYAKGTNSAADSTPDRISSTATSVAKYPIPITAVAKSITYGDSLSTLQFKIANVTYTTDTTISTGVGSEKLAIILGASNVNAGTRSIDTVSANPDTTEHPEYYNLSLTPATLTIAKATQTIQEYITITNVGYSTSAATVYLPASSKGVKSETIASIASGTASPANSMTFGTSITVKKGTTTVSGWTLSNVGLLTIPAKTSTGTYTVTLSITSIATTNYNAATTSKDYSVKIINSSIAQVTTVPTYKTVVAYDGTAQTLINAGTASNGTMKYAVTTSNSSTAPTSGWSTTLPSKSSAGTYYVWYYAAGNDGYNDSTKTMISGSVTIPKATPSIAITNGSTTYPTTSQGKLRPSVSGTVYYKTTGESWPYTDNTKHISADTPSVVVTRTSSSNVGTTSIDFYFVPDDTGNYNNKYDRTNPGTVTATINQATPTITTTDPANKTYSTSSQTVTLGASSNSGATCTFSTTITVTNASEQTQTGWSLTSAGVLTIPASAAANTYSIVTSISCAATTNYKAVSKGLKTYQLSINKATNPFALEGLATNPKYNSESALGSIKEAAGTGTTVYYAVDTQLTSSNYSTVGSTTMPTATAGYHAYNSGTQIEHMLYFYIPDTTNYNSKNGGCEFRIDKATPSFTSSDGSVKYPNTAEGKVLSSVGGTVYYGTSTGAQMTSTKTLVASTRTTIVSRTSSSNIGVSTVYAYFVPSNTDDYTNVGSSTSGYKTVKATTTTGDGTCTLSKTTDTYTSPNSSTVTKPVQNNTLTYNGSQQTAHFTNETNHMTISDVTGTGAGTYYATASLADTTYFEEGTKTFDASGTGNITASSSDTSAVTVSYSSSSSTSKTITVTIKKAFTSTVTITVTSAATTNYAAKTATYTVTKSSSGSYLWTDGTAADLDVPWTIGRATPTFTGANDTTTYPNTAGGKVTASVAGTAYYGLSSSSMTSTLSLAANTPKTIITATTSGISNSIYAYFVPTDSANYKNVGSSSSYAVKVTATMNKATISSVAAPTAKNPTYNGSSQQIINNGATGNGTYTYSNHNQTNWKSGGYSVTWSFSPDINHVVASGVTTSGTVTANITKKSVSLSIPTGQSKPYSNTATSDPTLQYDYNGTTKNSGTTISLTNPTESITINVSRTGGEEIGTYALSLSTTNTNYSLSYTSQTFAIVKATPVITVSGNGTYTYNGSARKLTASVAVANIGAVAGTLYYGADNTTSSSVSYSSGSTEIGSITNAASSGSNSITRYVKFTPTDTTHYNSVTVKGPYTITINQATGTVTYSPAAKSATYKTSSQTVAISTASTNTGQTISYTLNSVNGDTTHTGWSLSGTTLTIPSTNAGSYTISVTASVANSTNYTSATSGTKTFTLTINKATPTLTVTNGTSNYPTTANGYIKATVAGKFTYKLSTADSWTTQASAQSANTNFTVVSRSTGGTTTAYAYFVPTDTVNYNNVGSTTDYKTITATVGAIANPFTIAAEAAQDYKSGGNLILITTTAGTGTTPYYAVDTQLTIDNYLSKGSTSIPKSDGSTNRGAGGHTVYYYIPATANYKAKADSITITIMQATPAITCTDDIRRWSNVTSSTVLEGKVSASVRGYINCYGGARYGVDANTATTIAQWSCNAGIGIAIAKFGFTPYDTINYKSVGYGSSSEQGTEAYYKLSVKAQLLPGLVALPNTTTESFQYRRESISPTYTASTTTMTTSGDTSKTNAGSYTINYVLTDSTHYTWTDETTSNKTKSWSITRYPLTITIADKSKYYNTDNPDLTFTYADTSYVSPAAIITPLRESITITLSTTAKKTSPTTSIYPIIATSSSTNYSLTNSKGTSYLSINKVTPTLSLSGGGTYTYDGNAKNIKATISPEANGIISYGADSSCSIGTISYVSGGVNVGTITNVGTLTRYAKWTPTDTTNYLTSATKNTTITITQRTVTYSAPTVVSGTLCYNGSTQIIAYINPASAGGTMYYKVTANSTKPSFSTSSWTSVSSNSTAVYSSAADAQTYYIWYYVNVSDLTNNTGTNLNTVLPASGTISKAINKKTNAITTTPTLRSGWTYDSVAYQLFATAGAVDQGTLRYAAVQSGSKITPADSAFDTDITLTKKYCAGTWYCWVWSSPDSTNYQSFAKTYIGTVTVTKRNITISATTQTKTYDGTVLTADNTVTQSGLQTNDCIDTLICSGSVGPDVGSTPKVIDTVKITHVPDSADITTTCYNITKNNGELVINNYIATLPTTWSGDSKYYHKTATPTATDYTGGTLKFATSTDSGTTKTWSSWSTTKPSRTAVGTTYVKCKVFADDDNHSDSAESSIVSLTIYKATDARATVTLYPRVFDPDGEGWVIAAVTEEEGIASYTLGLSDGYGAGITRDDVTWEADNVPIIRYAAGTYYVWYKFSPDQNHSNEQLGAYVGMVTIDKASGNISYSPANKSVVYGTTKVNCTAATNTTGQSITYSLVSVNDSTSTSGWSLNGTQLSLPGSLGVGGYKITITATSVANSNYYAASKTASFTLTVYKASPVITTTPTTKSSVTYDGNYYKTCTQGGSNDGTLYYYVRPDDGESYPDPAVYPNAWKTYTNITQVSQADYYNTWYYLKGDSNHNDSAVSQVAGCFLIAKRTITLNWGTTSWKYDAQAHSTTCTAGNLVNSDACTITLSGNSVGPTVGTATVTAASVSNSNYQLPSTTTKTIEITPAAYLHSGSAWQPVKDIYIWNGSAWVRTYPELY